ncbi:class I SAM-dependent methyltransferase [Kitasatospora mediocidica]|uniref:class I SAM-dependent methyltransferase n=1 Tax=Kitasatospora mediocidica TaxID=58352 RepID=UPI000560BDC0|nr:methyltransferase [Kitasatospora mediocidica]
MSGSHYFTSDPDAVSERREITVTLPDITLELTTDAGVFSRGKLDPGTRVLLEHAPPPRVRGPILDLGCGYGPIALTWASRRKRSAVWGVDVNSRALELLTHNAQSLKLGNVQAALPDDVPQDVVFGSIYSNPPIRVGKAVMHEMMHRWLARLAPEGSAFLVVQRNLGADSFMQWLNDQGYPTTRVTSVNGFRILEARPRTDGAGPDSGRGTS